MKKYHIIIACPPCDDKVKAMGMTAGEAFRKSTHRNNLTALARQIINTVLKDHGGRIVNDGSGYGQKGNPAEFVDTITVETTPAAINDLTKIKKINRISEHVDFEKLSAAPRGGSNVPHGFSWNRKGI